MGRILTGHSKKEPRTGPEFSSCIRVHRTRGHALFFRPETHILHINEN